MKSTGADRGQYGPETRLRDLTDRFSYDSLAGGGADKER